MVIWRHRWIMGQQTNLFTNNHRIQSYFFFSFFYSEKFRGSGIFRCSDKHRLKLMSDQYQTTMPTAEGKYTLTFPIV